MATREDLIGADILAEIPQEPADVGDRPAKTETESLVGRMIEEAINWRQDYLDEDMARATDFYMGRPFGNEEEGRSKIVMTEVRDAVNAVMPSLMRIFFGPERVVEFRPDNGEDIPVAEQQTDTVNYIVTEDNKGFMVLYSAIKDALVRKMGIVKWWWEEAVHVEGAEYTGLSQEALDFLLAAEGVTPREITEIQQDDLPSVFDVEIERRSNRGAVKIDAVPPEEWIFTPQARNIEDALLVGNVREVDASELRAMGIAEDVISRNRGTMRGRRTGEEQLPTARRPDRGSRFGTEDESSRSSRPVLFADVWVELPVGGEENTNETEVEVTELRHVQAIGNGWEIVLNEPAPDKPFAVFAPDPEPHTMVGLSYADLVMDLQLIKSAIVRGMMDSLAQTLDPVTEIVDGRVNMADLLNKEVSRIVRVSQPGMMREVATPFVGAEALPVINYLDEVSEQRTGRKNGSMGLDADTLQSSTKAAVAATLSAAQQRLELIARIFAETGMTDLYSGILRLITRHQDQARVIRLRNEWVQVDPRDWNADKDVTVNVALGAVMTEEKIQILERVLAEQKENIQLGSPLVNFTQYRHTLGRLTELAGFPDSNEFFLPWSAEQQAKFEQAQAANQEPSEVEALLEVEKMKAEIDLMKTRTETLQKSRDMVLEDDRERDKMAMEFALKLAEIEGNAGVAEINAMVEAARVALDRDIADHGAFQSDLLQLLGGGQDGGQPS